MCAVLFPEGYNHSQMRFALRLPQVRGFTPGYPLRTEIPWCRAFLSLKPCMKYICSEQGDGSDLEMRGQGCFDSLGDYLTKRGKTRLPSPHKFHRLQSMSFREVRLWKPCNIDPSGPHSKFMLISFSSSRLADKN